MDKPARGRFVHLFLTSLFMKKEAFSLLFLFCLLLAFSADSQITWEKLFSKKSTDAFRCVIEVPTGGYLIAGYTADSTVSDTDAFVVRMRTAGDTIWKKRINGPNNGKEVLYKVINTSDGGFAFCGYSTNNGAGNDDAYFLKMDSVGNIEWLNYWGGAGKDRAQDIIQTPDGGYAITGYSTTSPALYYDAFILKLNATGDTLWSKFYGGGGFEDANAIVLMPDNGFIIGGQGTNGANGLDMFLTRTNETGDTLWTKKFGSLATDNIENILRLSDGSFILTGGTDDPVGFGGNDGILVKVDSSGNTLWSKIYGGNSQDDFHQVYRTTDNGYILSGTSRSSGLLEPNMWLVKTDENGDSLWSQTYGGDNHDHGYGAVQTLDGGYIFVGYSSSFGFNGEDAYIVKTDSLGNIYNTLTYISVTALTNPPPTLCASSNVQVKVVIRNFGRNPVPNVPVNIEITGPNNLTINETYNGIVNPGDLDTLTFLTRIDLSQAGNYTFNCVSANLNNVCPPNNNFTATRTVFSLPVLDLGPDTINFTQQAPALLDAGSGFSSYLWSTGETTQTITVTATSLINVRVTDSNGCQASDTIYANELVGIDDISAQLGLKIYPNPSSGVIFFQTEKSVLLNSIEILNMLGQSIYSNSFLNNNQIPNSIDLSSQEKGVYFLLAKTPLGSVTKRIVIQ